MYRAQSLMGKLDLKRLILPNSDRLLLQACVLLLRERTRGRSTPTRLLLLRTPAVGFRLQRSVLIGILKSILARFVPICGRDARCFFLTDAFGVVTSRRGYGKTQPVRDVSPGLTFTSKAIARRQLGIETDSFVIGIFGDLSRRKFPELSIQALESLPQYVELVAAGRMDVETCKAIRTYEAAGGTRIHALDGYVSDDTLATHISSCDAMVLTYETDAPSGMLVSAFEAGIPVIAAGSPWLTRIVSEMRLGVVTDLSAVGLASSVKFIMTEATQAPPQRLFPSEVPSLVHALVCCR
jgi:glycosyltransferase involved in cell wall biosynthesis